MTSPLSRLGKRNLKYSLRIFPVFKSMPISPLSRVIDISNGIA